jgi:hypothetical protein
VYTAANASLRVQFVTRVYAAPKVAWSDPVRDHLARLQLSGCSLGRWRQISQDVGRVVVINQVCGLLAGK